MQTQTSNTLHNAIMEAGSKDRPPMLAHVYHPQHHLSQYTQNSSTRSQQAATRNRGKAIINSLQPIYDQEPAMAAEDDKTSKDKEIDKLMALIPLSEEIDQNDDDYDLAKERELLASLIEKLKCEIDESKNRNKFLETSNKVLIEKLKELARRNSKEYASQMELKCAKVRGDLLSYKMEYQKSCTKYTEMINDLNQTISEMKDKLSAHQETISILSK
nr:hypothetical protein [Tanacetum cinerariifolium]